MDRSFKKNKKINKQYHSSEFNPSVYDSLVVELLELLSSSYSFGSY